MPRWASSLRRSRQHRQRFQAQKVELHQAGRLDPFHVELGRRHVRLRIAVERHELGERAVADHDAGRMRRGVRIETFEHLGDIQHPRDRGSAAAASCSRGSPSIAWSSVTGLGGVLRHELGELVDLPERHLQHAADIAQDAARQEGAEGDDLRDAVRAVAPAHVGDDLVAPVLAKVDVEIRHRDALGIEEALEQQAETQRVEIGDGQRLGDERACARPASRPDRDPLRLRPLDEVGDDQEIARELHA